MPLTAISNSVNDRIFIDEFDEIKLLELRKDKDLFCPACHAQMSVRGIDSDKMRKHFFHLVKDDCLLGGESAEHHLAKNFLFQKYKRDSAFYTGGRVRVELEVMTPDRKQIADIMLTYPFGLQQAIEAQISGITTEKLHERITGYESQAIDSKWYFGPRAATRQIRDYYYSYFGEWYEIDFSQQQDTYTQD